jgi:ribonuclease Z
MRDLITGFSRGMYSNWLWYRPLQFIVDAGEGLQLALGPRIFAPTHLFITHGHSDHLLGLPGFVAARRFSKGATDKPLTILYPQGSRNVETIRAMLERLWPREQFPLTWVPVVPGVEQPYDRLRIVHVFETRHVASEPSVGYRVLELRRRLRPEYAGLPQQELEARARAGERERMMEPYRHVLFAHTGDSMPVDPALFARADLLVHDATFLDPDDRRDPIHATAAEALAVAREAGVKRLLLQHLSVRYARAAALRRLRQLVRREQYPGECWLLDDETFIKLGPEGEPTERPARRAAPPGPD